MAAERPDKKEKKEKKEKRSEEAGVSKPKKEKKEKKEKKDKKDKLASVLDEKLQQDVAAQTSVNDSEEASDMDEDKPAEVALERTVVPFAIPLADEKGQKKICKTIRKGINMMPFLPLSLVHPLSFCALS
jgi:H/ACA ribonucleoprotein complex subunit 2